MSPCKLTDSFDSLSAIKSVFTACARGITLSKEDLKFLERALEKEQKVQAALNGSEKSSKVKVDAKERLIERLRKMLMS